MMSSISKPTSFSNLRSALVCLLFLSLLSLPAGPSFAASPGNLLDVLETNLRFLDPTAGDLLACSNEGVHHLRLTEEGLVCDGQLDFDLEDVLKCSRDGGLCIVDNLIGGAPEECDGAEETTVELDLIGLRRAGSDEELSWDVSAEALRAGGTTCGLCGNYDEAEERMLEAIEICPDFNQDGASDMVYYRDSLRCLTLDPYAPPMANELTLTVSVPCDGSDPLERALEALEATTSISTLVTAGGAVGVEILISNI